MTKLTIALSVALLVASCTNKEQQPSQKELTGVNATISEAEEVTTFGTGFATGFPKEWESSDALNLVGNSLATFSISNGFKPKNADFKGKFPDMPASGYSIFYPSEITSQEEFDAYSYENQVQFGNDNYMHIQPAMMLSGVKNPANVEFSQEWADNNGVSFAMSSCIKFELGLPAEVAKVGSIVLSAPSKLFYATNGADSMTDSLKLSLSDVDLSQSGNKLVAYMAISSQTVMDAGNVMLTVKVYLPDGSYYYRETSVEALFLNGGYMYTLEMDASGWGKHLPLPKVLKVLAIGNSFSADAVETKLANLITAAGQEVIIGELYYSGSQLYQHMDFITKKSAVYRYTKIVNCKNTDYKNSTFLKGLKDEAWDFISIQEGGGFHGYYDRTFKTSSYGTFTHSMEPDMTNIINYIRENCTNPNVKFIYHAPWASPKSSTHEKFKKYDCNQETMVSFIRESAQQAFKAHPGVFSLYMNSVDVIQNGRTTYLGDDWMRDGWHLNYTYARYAVSCLWCEKLLGKSVIGNTYRPSEVNAYVASLCQRAAHEAALHPNETIDISADFPKP